jgi:glycogen operon protein
LRGLDGACYFRMREGQLVNDTGCGNTLDCKHPATQRLILDALRHFVRNCAVDGFRFDLATVLGRTDRGFDPQAPLLRGLLADPLLSDRILIAEPWDIGPGGYQLGNFPPPFLEWNDRYRDDARRFWRGDPGMLGQIATRIAGSADIFQKGAQAVTRSVSYLAAHDGFTLADSVCYERRHNEANGEANRDGHAENFSWNHGVEGPTTDVLVNARRAADVRAMLAMLFATRGPIMLTAGDEFGRSQQGNNNAYAQNNAISWVDWASRDQELEDHVVALAELRAHHPALGDPRFIAPGEVRWLRADGHGMQREDWENPDGTQLAMLLSDIAVLINRSDAPVTFAVPEATVGAHSIRFVPLAS